jgi:hypothetical protein
VPVRSDDEQFMLFAPPPGAPVDIGA